MLDPTNIFFCSANRLSANCSAGLGAGHLEFIPAIFGFYDMSFIVSRRPLTLDRPWQRTAALCRTVEGRFIQALLDLDDRRLNLLAKYR